MKTNLLHYLSPVYFVNQSLHVSGIFVAHRHEPYHVYTTTGTDSHLESTTRTNCQQNVKNKI